MFRVFDPYLNKVVFRADSYQECLDYKVRIANKDFYNASILRIIRPDDKTFDKTFKLND